MGAAEWTPMETKLSARISQGEGGQDDMILSRVSLTAAVPGLGYRLCVSLMVCLDSFCLSSR